MSDKPTVFISYSHKDEEWKDRLVVQLKVLEQLDRIIIWDDRKIDAGDKWYKEIRTAMEEASFTVCIISADYLASDFIVKEEVPFLLERREKEGMTIIPVLLHQCLWEEIDWIEETQMIPRDGKSVCKDFKDDFDIPFKDVAKYISDRIKHPDFKIPVHISSWTPLPTEHVSIERLPVTGAELFGRQTELKLLNEAWDKGNLNTVSFVASGGVGKSTLTNKWLESMKTDNFRGANRVYGWSFYSQGTGEKVTSADLFIADALHWFGDPDPKEGSPWDKGQRLADLIRREKTLLVLDGLEPLQSAHDFEKGKIKDAALSVLIEELSRENPGLLIITTRVDVAVLKELNEHVEQKNLDQITAEAGRALLRTAGVRGTDKELEEASISFGNHALALRLLGSWLYEEEGHRIDHASRIPDLDHIPENKGRHPRRVMAAFEERFGEGAEVELLRMLGLFDRPVEQGAIKALLEKKVIPNLTWHFKRLTKTGQKDMFSKLRKLKLIAEESSHDKGKLDAHPLVREHFGEQLKEDYPDAWKEGNSRLYEYFKKQAPELPDNLEEMSPLFLAVGYGCAAERHHEAMSDVYWTRIRLGGEAFSTRNLGAFGADLACVSHFFETQWYIPLAGLREDYKAAVLNWAGFRLRALGRLEEAKEPMQESLKIRIVLKDWVESARDANNLSELYLAIGEVIKSIEYAEKGVQYADKSGDYFQKMSKRTAYADALHQAGRIGKAGRLFREAEKMQKNDQPEYPYLYSLGGYRYCALLLGKGNYEEVLHRAKKTIKIGIRNKWLLNIALDHLSIGCAHLLKDLKEDCKDYSEAEKHLNEAVDGLRNAGTIHHIPRGLLARTELFRIKNDYSKAIHDLDEVMTIVIRSEMKLFEADCHLGYARLFHAMDDKLKADEHLSTAQEMINKMGYHRRDKDVKEIEGLLG